MENAAENRASEMARGRAVKRVNAFTAAGTGSALAVAALALYPMGRLDFLPLLMFAGILAGVVYANAFEYVLHRYLLHWGEGFLVQRHDLHHSSSGTPAEPRYVNFTTSPWVVVLVFALNAPPVFVVARWLNPALAAGIFAGFTAYFVLYEEIHWRIHFGGWLPKPLRPARRHHLLHHKGFPGRYNVFLPLFDWLFERREWKRTTPRLSRHAT